MRRKLIYLAMFVMVLVALGLWVRHFRRSSPSERYGGSVGPDSDTPVARALRLLGVQPYGSDDLLDANGEKVGEMFALAGEHDNPLRPGANLRRCFVLELPKTAEPILFQDQFPLRSSRAGRVLGGQVRSQRIEHEGKRLMIYNVRIPDSLRESGLFSSHRVPVETVDLTVRFYHGPARDCQASFAGPFAPGSAPRQCDEGSCTLTVQPPGDPRGTDFTIDSKRRLDVSGPVLLYDKLARRHVANRHGYSSGSRGTTMQCSLGELRWDQVARVVVGERPQQKTFRNIRVRYADRPEVGYPAYIQRMAKALGRPAKDVARRGPIDASEALKVMHLARGDQVQRLCDKLVRLKLADVPADQRAGVRKVISVWLAAPSPAIRLCGVKLGLSTGAEGAVRAAVGLLNCGDRSVASQTGYSLRRYAKDLSNDDIRPIAQALRASDNRAVDVQLVACLVGNRTPAATEALQQIALGDERPWLWWKAIESLHSRKAESGTEPPPKKLRLRRILARGAKEGDESLAAEAYGMLPALLTPEYSHVDGAVFQQIYGSLRKHTNRPTATKAIVDFLRQLGTQRHSLGHADRMVKQLNVWYAVNLGRLGWDVGRNTPDYHKRDWPAIVPEVLRWYERGGANQAPAATAAGGLGPIVAKTVQSRSRSDPSYVDLDTAALLVCPDDVYRGGRKAREAWVRKNAVDLRLSAYGKAARLEGHDWSISTAPDVWWRAVAAEQVRLALSLSAKRARYSSTEVVSSAPATFCFETREGTVGLLRVLRFDPAARTVTVQWRRLRSTASAPAGGGSAPARP